VAAEANVFQHDTLLQASEQFRRMHDRFREKPILGLASQQQQKFRHIKKKILKIRKRQAEIFSDQLRQFPQFGVSCFLWRPDE